MNQKFADYQLPPKADDEDETKLSEEYWRELLHQAENDEELKFLLQAQNSILMKEMQKKQIQMNRTGQSHTTQNIQSIHMNQHSDGNADQKMNHRNGIASSNSLNESNHSNHYDDSTPQPSEHMQITDTATIDYMTAKFRSEYMQLKEKYSTALDLAFFFSNLVHQQQLYSEQVKKSQAHRELELTTLKQNIEALNSALKRSQKATSLDRQKQMQLIDNVLKDYDNVLMKLQDKKELLTIIEQQKNHIVEQEKLIEALKHELNYQGKM